ncbi:hypothetical protein [Geobacillus sp. C56-T2]|uniref:hypothetical protein n=1 Tax=Geobacillus sp. C56-T2 TaxID=600773 RepID=UPI0011AAC896|nr:hypothetical protein [Geobacillus sp. C56-T2]TWG32127.1 hypothetical protein GC56T2_3405 [Geobacillus sp. C56-T2]
MLRKQNAKRAISSLTSALMVMWGILFAFGAANVAATEKPKPDVKESDELDNVLTGVKVVNGMATNLYKL